MSRKRKPLSHLPIDEEPKKLKRENGIIQHPRRAGIVNRIILRNFMCHSLLEVDFTINNVNFVIGRNGSGKSAILTALIIGLGGKASLTNRGSSVKGFIKVGKTSASIEIELCNEGPMSYKPRIYGKTITIVRHLTTSGGSYKIKSSTGEVISTQAKEVQNITSCLSIQIDNPVCLLTQDTSRNFLSSKDPKNKFSLFMKATRLEMLEAIYKKISATKNDCCMLMADKKKNFSNLEDEIKQLKNKIDGHQLIVSLKEKKVTLQKEMFWAQVRDVEEELSQQQQKMNRIVKKMEVFRISSLAKIQDTEIYEKNIKEYEMQHKNIKGQLGIQGGRETDNKRQLDQLQASLSGKKREKQDISIQIESKNRDVQNLQKEIAEASENMSKAELQKQQRMRELDEIQKKLREHDSHLETTRNDLIHIKSDLARKREDEASLRSELDHIDRKIASEKSSLEALRKESGNVLMLYGRNIPQVLELIKQHASRFTEKPKGPLGSYIKLRDKKWAVAVEGYLGQGMLRAFTVNSQQDSKLLQQIFAMTTDPGLSQPIIITSKFFHQKHDVTKNLVQSPKDCVSLYDILTFDDPVVANCIIDQMSVESILLVPNNERAMELMSHKDNVPPNCAQAVTIHGDRYYPDPRYKTYASTYHRARFLQVDTEEHAQLIEENINNMTNKRQVMSNQLQALKKEMYLQIQQQTELEEKIKKVNIVKSRIRTRYEDLNNQLEPEAHDITNLETVLQEVQQTILAKTAAMDKVDEEITELQRKIVETKDTLVQTRKAYKSLEERSCSLLEQIEQNGTKIRQMASEKDYDQKRLKEYQKKVDEVKNTVVVKQNDVQKKVDDALKLGERPEELRPVPDIINEVQEVSKNLLRIETRSDDIEQVTAKYQELVDKHKNVAEIIRHLTANVKVLSKSVEERKRHYKLTENYFVTFMKHSFKRILEIRQFNGMIEIDIAQKKLDLVVMPQQGALGASTTSNLSGGERSFSTVAFLYALWQCMDFPFYFLDEFDVYMDKLNRTKVIDILLHHARSKPELQFIFLTPQDVSFLPQDVTVLKLSDPERNT